MDESLREKRAVLAQASYTSYALYIYDLLVLYLSNTFVWRCPTSLLIDHYNKHLSSNHLDVGVGTGYLLDHALFPASASPRIALMDMNAAPLAHSARRLARYGPVEQYQRNVLRPLDLPHDTARFDSVGINYLLHCVPGLGMADKAMVFDHLRSVMTEDGTLFGATILGQEVPRSWLAQWVATFYNRKGIFNNELDSLTGLKTELERRFAQVQIDVEGCVAVFSAKN